MYISLAGLRTPYPYAYSYQNARAASGVHSAMCQPATNPLITGMGFCAEQVWYISMMAGMLDTI